MGGRLLLLVVCLAPLIVRAQDVPLGLDLHVPAPDDNPGVARNITRGRQLFVDGRLSRDGSVSCASCHDPGKAFTDGRAVSVGIGGARGGRNAPALLNLAYARVLFWDGRALTLEQLVRMPIELPHEMDLPVATAAGRVGLSPRDLSLALAAYVRSILAGGSRFDRFVAGDPGAFSAEQQAGLEVFRGKGNCIACHVGPTFSDGLVHNTGVAWRNGRLTDVGAGAGRFKTPTLREVTRTAPYMHDGSLMTLEAVIEHYDRGGNRHKYLDPTVRPLGLSPTDKQSLRAFMDTLEGEVREGVPLRMRDLGGVAVSPSGH